MNRPPAEFRTDSLYLRPPKVDDAEAIFRAYAGDSEVTRYLIWPPYTEIEDLRAYLRESAANREGGNLHPDVDETPRDCHCYSIVKS